MTMVNSSSSLLLPLEIEELKKSPGIVYWYYQSKVLSDQLGKTIHNINNIFFNEFFYLDALISQFSVDQIKKLNEAGYVIGKYTHYFSSVSLF